MNDLNNCQLSPHLICCAVTFHAQSLNGYQVYFYDERDTMIKSTFYKNKPKSSRFKV